MNLTLRIEPKAAVVKKEGEIGNGQGETSIIDNPRNKGFNFCEMILSS
jgi:hypothetical protein